MPSTNGHGSKPERIALYIRVSSEEQRDRETIEIQREFLKVEQDTEEAFRVRRQLVRLLVEGITAGERHEDGNTEIRITYRFDPPEDARPEDVFVGGITNAPLFLKAV